MGAGPFAVRSSGREEDGTDSAHAGQFETELNVAAGLRAAEAFRSRRLIEGAALFLQGERRVAGALALEMGDASG